MENQKFKPLIKCPNCGYEYLPAEIYLPDVLLGQPDDIVRDKDGHIEFFSGENMNTAEQYACDKCGCVFDIIGNVEFKTHLVEAPADDDVYVVNL